jgi:hypothetical protein
VSWTGEALQRFGSGSQPRLDRLPRRNQVFGGVLDSPDCLGSPPVVQLIDLGEGVCDDAPPVTTEEVLAPLVPDISRKGPVNTTPPGPGLQRLALRSFEIADVDEVLVPAGISLHCH